VIQKLWESVKNKSVKESFPALSERGLKDLCDSISTCMSILNPREWNLYRKTLVSRQSSAAGRQAAGYLMISYNHGSKAAIKQLRQKMADQGIQFWIDDEQMSSHSLIEMMANAVEGLNFILEIFINWQLFNLKYH